MLPGYTQANVALIHLVSSNKRLCVSVREYQYFLEFWIGLYVQTYILSKLFLKNIISQIFVLCVIFLVQ